MARNYEISENTRHIVNSRCSRDQRLHLSLQNSSGRNDELPIDRLIAKELSGSNEKCRPIDRKCAAPHDLSSALEHLLNPSSVNISIIVRLH